MSSKALDYSAETNTDSSADTKDSSNETNINELASNFPIKALLKSSDLGDVNPITSSLSIEDHVRTSLLELPLCITSKQISLPSSSETSSSSRRKKKKDIPEMKTWATPTPTPHVAQSI
ncbi:hypothetical protein POTOM_047435 [Populus tomentosa]|uniref:Uncharacterized protein n=1 Tax=Populus tomentosa TaxID=118781 RepID=A0A8X8CC98_POPTO|nr:hypothetical protein POTOM_047435 [Populus tomentosa]